MKVFYVVYHNLIQLGVFAHNNQIPLRALRPVVEVQDLRGIHHDAVLLCLPGYRVDRRKCDAVEAWTSRGGRIQSIATGVVLGDRPLVLETERGPQATQQQEAPTP